MRFLIERFKKNNLHHATLIKGIREEIIPELTSLLKKYLNIKTSGNPDFWMGEFDTFSISDGRALKEAHIRKAFTGERKIFVISANSITNEAQNALLKTFEDAVSGTHFFLVFPPETQLLPTFLSRLEVYTNEKKKDGNEKFVSEFLDSNPADRIGQLQKLIESKDKAKSADFLNGLEMEVKKRVPSPISKEYAFLFKEIIKCRKYLTGRSPSVKIILEYISLITPL